MGSILELHNEWRDSLRIASFRGIFFHVETSGRTSGRRTVVHQYPKRNIPYAEDMGREAVHWSFSAYIILNDKRLHASANHGRSNSAPYANLIAHRNSLVEALEMDGPGELIHPTLSIGYGGGRDGSSYGGPMMVMVERYGISESRQKGAFYEFDLAFVEAGEAPQVFKDDSRKLLTSATSAIDAATLASVNKQFAVSGSAGIAGKPGSPSGPAAIRIR
jgi:prophage DNA circulation protein